MTRSSRSLISSEFIRAWTMRISVFIFAGVLTMLISCAERSSPPETVDAGPELVHSISEFNVEYQSRAETVAKDLMQHWPAESYIRWRPVRIQPSEVLNHDFLKPGAMLTSFSLSPFKDTKIHVRQTSYTIFKHINQAIWEGKTLNSDNSTVEITIVGMDEGPAFVIKIGSPPNNYSIFATDSLDVYIAVEIPAIRWDHSG